MELLELIKGAKAKNTAAQKSLFEMMAPKMLILCRRYIKTVEDAEEVLLDGFCKVFDHLSSFNYKGDAWFYAWIKKIMINECLMFLRRTNLLLIATESVAEDVPLQEEALNNLSAAEIFNQVTQLPPGYRIVFNLYEIDGLSHKEIAKLLGITEGTSKSQLSKSKKMLQKMIIQNQHVYVTKKST